jgi:hypothetical protein
VERHLDAMHNDSGQPGIWHRRWRRWGSIRHSPALEIAVDRRGWPERIVGMLWYASGLARDRDQRLGFFDF